MIGLAGLRRVVACALALLAAAVLLEAGGAIAAEPNYPAQISLSTTVDAYVVGDSLTAGAVAAGFVWMSARAGQGTLVDAQKGRHITEGVTALGHLKYYGYLPRVVIIALGTNDSTASMTPEAFRAQLDRAMVWCGPRKCIFMDLWRTDERAGAARALNAEIYALPARSPNASYVRWSVYAAQHPEWMQADGVHYTAAGYDFRARYMVNIVTGAI